jgi:hypothetical protein
MPPGVSTQEHPAAEGGTLSEKCLVILPNNDLHATFRDLLHAVKLRHGTDGSTSPSEERCAQYFFCPINPTTSAGCEPANLGTKGQHATLDHRSR